MYRQVLASVFSRTSFLCDNLSVLAHHLRSCMFVRSLLSILAVISLASGCSKQLPPEEQELRASIKRLQRLANPPESQLTHKQREALIQRIQEFGALQGLLV